MTIERRYDATGRYEVVCTECGSVLHEMSLFCPSCPGSELVEAPPYDPAEVSWLEMDADGESDFDREEIPW